MKVLQGNDDDRLARDVHLHELRLMQSLPEHRHIVALRGYCVLPDALYICLEVARRCATLCAVGARQRAAVSSFARAARC